MRPELRQRVVGGVALIVLGLGLWALQRFDALGPSAPLLLVGGVLLAAYFLRRGRGLLVTGCILLGLGAGAVGRASLADFGSSSSLALGFAFVAISVIALTYERRATWWPLIPGAALIALGLPNTREILRFAYEHWPLSLVVVGVLVLFGVLGRPRSRAGS